jgi:hypothetical protein
MPLGITANIAFALGCHVDAESLSSDFIEVEQRRRSRSIIASLDHDIGKESRKVHAKFYSDGETGQLQNHHIVQRHILEMYTHQLYLLLHRPFFDPGRNEEQEASRSREKCVTSAKVLVESYRDFFQNPQFKDFKWFGIGIGSFLAFHGAVALSASIMDGKEDSSVSLAEVTSLLDETMERFEQLTERSAICAKGLPILQYLRSVPPTINQNYQSFRA